MVSEWRKTTVGEFAPFFYGKGLPESQRDPEGKVPVFGSNGIVGFHREALVPRPAVIIGRKGTVGAVHHSPMPCWPIDTTFYVFDEDPELLRFKYYLLKSLGLDRMNADSAVPGLNRDAAHARAIRVPPLAEQRAIAHILGTLDDKIELNRRMNATLEATARAIFKSWFVDFDPVHAKMRGEQPAGMDAATAALFPDAFEDSELGPIPTGWGVKTVGDEFSVTMGQSPPGETYNEDGVGLPFYQGRRDFSFRYPSLRVYCTAPTRFARAGDTLVSVRAPVGDLNMALEECCIGRGVAALRHKSGARSYTYYAIASLSADFERFEAEGTVFGSLSGKDFRNLAFLAPPNDVVQKFEALTTALDSLIETNERQNLALAELRDTLLPKLISGELPVGELIMETKL